MIIRDSAYLKWASYHNYRDSNVDDFSDIALELAEKGYVVFRMGKKVNKPLNLKHPNVIDYACSNYRSDFLDIWLMANCFFCISTGLGLDEIPRIFRRPSIYIDYIPLQSLVSYDHVITVPKKLFWRQTNKMLTLSECLSHSYDKSKEYEDANIEINDISSNEIYEAVMEMEKRLNNDWKESSKDQKLQKEFWKIFKSHSSYRKFNNIIHPKARIGSDFLRNNSKWLN